jgi:integrase
VSRAPRVSFRSSGGPAGLVFGRDADRAFDPGTITKRARRAWTATKYAPIGLHECRHTFASFMIAAGVNAKALSAYMARPRRPHGTQREVPPCFPQRRGEPRNPYHAADRSPCPHVS